MSITTIKSLLINYFPDDRGVDKNLLVRKGYEDFYLSAVDNGYLKQSNNGKLYITISGNAYRDN